MKNLKSMLLLAAASLTFSQAALANGPEVAVTATAVPTTATLSSNRTNYASYSIDVKNITYDDTVQILKVAVSTKVTQGGLATAFKANFFSSTGATCAPVLATDRTSIECTISPATLPAGQSRSFVVVFTTPAGGDQINMSAIARYAEYEHNEAYVDLSDIEYARGLASTALEAANGERVNTFLPASAAPQTVFTGAGATSSALATDQLTTKINVPFNPASTVQLIDETLASSCSAVLNKCFASTVLIPGVTFVPPNPVLPSQTPNLLVVFLQFDVSVIGAAPTSLSTLSTSSYYKPKPPSINDLKLLYSHDLVSYAPVANCVTSYGVPIVTTGPYGLPRAGVPCIARRKAFGKYYPVPVADQGDWLLEIWALDNGRYVTQ